MNPLHLPFKLRRVLIGSLVLIETDAAALADLFTAKIEARLRVLLINLHYVLLLIICS